ncbi:hypothetical protein [Desulfitobacterium sp. Sab5]|uniref:hypothetical protein n=1 Tax=Desulfitobacterium nosdiversum TaxID=3375356 RepID=UPI003CF0D955
MSDQLLTEVALLANGNLSEPAVRSGEFVTDKTLRAETKTQELSCIAIDTSLTQEELLLHHKSSSVNTGLENSVRLINEREIALTKELVLNQLLYLYSLTMCCVKQITFYEFKSYQDRQVHFVRSLGANEQTDVEVNVSPDTILLKKIQQFPVETD